jgi:hypothetical protein
MDGDGGLAHMVLFERARPCVRAFRQKGVPSAKWSRVFRQSSVFRAQKRSRESRQKGTSRQDGSRRLFTPAASDGWSQSTRLSARNTYQTPVGREGVAFAGSCDARGLAAAMPACSCELRRGPMSTAYRLPPTAYRLPPRLRYCFRLALNRPQNSKRSDRVERERRWGLRVVYRLPPTAYRLPPTASLFVLFLPRLEPNKKLVRTAIRMMRMLTSCVRTRTGSGRK